MKTILESLKKLRIGKHTLWFLVMVAGAALSYFLLFFLIGPFAPMSRYPAAFMLMFVGVAAWMYFDRIYFSEIDTIEALRSGNNAYAIMMLAIAIIIASVIITV